MGKKLTLEIVKERLKSTNIEILSSKYVNASTPLHCKCKICGNEWKARSDKLCNSGTGCPECAKLKKGNNNKKYTLDKVKENLKHLPISILSSAYKRSDAKLQCKCNLCNEIFESPYATLRKAKVGCPKCGRSKSSTNQKLSINEVAQKLSALNITLIDSEYKGVHTPLKVRCNKCGYEWAKRVASRSGCPRCSSKLKLTLEQIKERVDKSVEVLSSSYKSRSQKLLCRCKICENEWQSSFGSLVQKTKCPVCAYKSRAEKNRLDFDEVKRQISSLNESIEIFSSSYKNSSTPLLCRCKVCNTEWKASHNNLVSKGSRCPKCARKQTKGEKYMQELFESLGIEFIMNDRKTLPSGKELDFYIPSLKIAVEINGELWHSSAQERIYKNYHLDKTRECEALGIHLFQFWHLNELIKKTEIMESMIKNALKLPQTTRIFARKCEVRRIDSKEGRAFCEQNHIQGGGIASVYFGLFYENKLVSVMSFGKARFNKKVEWELIRFCSLLNHSVVGAGSRLLKHFERECKPKSLISYANRRWASANSNLYQKLGFKFVREAEPNYTYYKENKYDGRMFNRITFQRHKIDKWFGKQFDKKMTEGEILESEGFVRIYDCGNLVYLKEYEEV